MSSIVLTYLVEGRIVGYSLSAAIVILTVVVVALKVSAVVIAAIESLLTFAAAVAIATSNGDTFEF